MASSSWAITQLSQILPLDNDSLQQMLDYTSTLSKDAAAEHLKDILGDSPKALEFISSYNSRRQTPPTAAKPTTEPATAVPRSQPKRKSKPPLNKLPAPRQVESHGDMAGAYQKGSEEDYMAGKRRPPHQESVLGNTLALSDKPDARQFPKPTTGGPSLKTPPSASGPLISDLPNVRSGSRTSSRNASPAPRTTVNVVGGASMHGASTTLQDLDSAIRTLELQTNPSLASLSSEQSSSARACSCNATRHPLLAAAPNCLNCGKIVCVKEGIGPCTFCNTPLLSSAEITSMIGSLKQSRGQEKMLANNASQRRADVASITRPFSAPKFDSTASPSAQGGGAQRTLDLAKQHRDRLLNYQAENARRTQIHDEAADYETPTAGLSQWSSPVERANQLKRQQKVLREQEWNAKPEYEKRRVVVSVDLVGGKVVKKMGNVERPEHIEKTILEDGATGSGGGAAADGGALGGSSGGAFSKNPLLGNLIRPMWKAPEDGKGKGKGKPSDPDSDADKENKPRKSAWRRVQDDVDDNEAIILDGGVYGGRENDRRLEHSEEPACG